MAWERINESQVLSKCRGAIRSTPEWAEIMHIVTTNQLPKGEALRLKKLPKVNLKNIAYILTTNLNKEFQRQGLPYRASSYGKGEVNVRHL